MSDAMLFGVLKMPFEMAMNDEISRRQFYQRVQELVARVEAQPEQEPSQWRDMVVVNLVREGINKHKARELADHFATPLAAQRPWVGLTDEEMSDTVADMEVDFGDLLWKVVCLTKLIEAKLKDRNNGP